MPDPEQPRLPCWYPARAEPSACPGIQTVLRGAVRYRTPHLPLTYASLRPVSDLAGAPEDKVVDLSH